MVDKTCLRRPEKLSTDRKAFIVELRGHQVEPHTHIGLVFDWTMGSCQVNLFKTWPGCSDVCSSSRKPVILSVVIAATVLLLFWHCFCCLFYCPLKWLQAIQVKPYESFNMTLFGSWLTLTQDYNVKVNRMITFSYNFVNLICFCQIINPFSWIMNSFSCGKHCPTSKAFFADWHANLPRFWGAQPDHLLVESLNCCFPRELVSFVRPWEFSEFWPIACDTFSSNRKMYLSWEVQQYALLSWRRFQLVFNS